MIPRLAFAVERRASEPGLAGRLGGRNAALEQVTQRLRGAIPILAARPSFAAMPPLALGSTGGNFCKNRFPDAESGRFRGVCRLRLI